MVLYHSLNYSTQVDLAYKILAFLPPSFIFITGFLISRIDSERSVADGRRTFLRLIVRGAKLVILFTALNAGAYGIGSTRRGGAGESGFFNHWFAVYISGNSHLAAFQVLLPIGYLLIAAPALLWARRHPWFLPGLTAALVTLCALAENSGRSWPILCLGCSGLIGMIAARLETSRLGYLGKIYPLALLAYIGVSWASGQLGYPYLLQLIGVCLALSAMYGFSLASPAPDTLGILGRYSLFSYIVQILLLRALSAYTGRPAPLSGSFAVLCAGTFLLMLLLVRLLDVIRTRSPRLDSVYRFIFA